MRVEKSELTIVTDNHKLKTLLLNWDYILQIESKIEPVFLSVFCFENHLGSYLW